MILPTPAKNITALPFSTHEQKFDAIHTAVEFLLGRAGCPGCGLPAHLDVSINVDPPAELAGLGVSSFIYE